MAPWSKSSLAGPLHISYPIKAPPAHAFQLQSKIYCPGAGLIQQDTAGTEGEKTGGGSNKCAWKVDVKKNACPQVGGRQMRNMKSDINIKEKGEEELSHTQTTLLFTETTYSCTLPTDNME